MNFEIDVIAALTGSRLYTWSISDSALGADLLRMLPSNPGCAPKLLHGQPLRPLDKELLLIDMHDDLNGLPLIESTLRKTGKVSE